MELSAPFVWFNGSTLSASVNFEHVRIGVIAVCFMLFPLSEGLAQSPSATSLCNMPSARGSAMYNQYCGGGYAAPRPYYAAPQPYVPRRRVRPRLPHNANTSSRRARSSSTIRPSKLKSRTIGTLP